MAKKTINNISREERWELEQILSALLNIERGNFYEDRAIVDIVQTLAVNQINVSGILRLNQKPGAYHRDGIFQYHTNATVPLPNYKYELESSGVRDHRAQ